MDIMYAALLSQRLAQSEASQQAAAKEVEQLRQELHKEVDRRANLETAKRREQVMVKLSNGRAGLQRAVLDDEAAASPLAPRKPEGAGVSGQRPKGRTTLSTDERGRPEASLAREEASVEEMEQLRNELRLERERRFRAEIDSAAQRRRQEELLNKTAVAGEPGRIMRMQGPAFVEQASGMPAERLLHEAMLVSEEPASEERASEEPASEVAQSLAAAREEVAEGVLEMQLLRMNEQAELAQHKAAFQEEVAELRALLGAREEVVDNALAEQAALGKELEESQQLRSLGMGELSAFMGELAESERQCRTRETELSCLNFELKQSERVQEAGEKERALLKSEASMSERLRQSAQLEQSVTMSELWQCQQARNVSEMEMNSAVAQATMFREEMVSIDVRCKQELARMASANKKNEARAQRSHELAVRLSADAARYKSEAHVEQALHEDVLSRCAACASNMAYMRNSAYEFEVGPGAQVSEPCVI